MTGSASHASLRRKARLARDEHDARAMSVTRALRLAVEKAADDDLSMPLAVQGLQHVAQDHAGLLGMLQAESLLILLDGPQGARGAVMLDIGVIASLIEAQTMGQVQKRPAAARPLTRTDAAMAAPLVDSVMIRLAAHLGDHADYIWACGFRFGVMMEDRRSLGLALSAPDFHVYEMTLDIGPGARTGAMLLALPVAEPATHDADDPAQARARKQFQGRVLEASVRLDAVLCRIALPLDRISQLMPGDLLPLPRDAMRSIALEGPGRRQMATAQLGKCNGMRALRLSFPELQDIAPPDPAQGRGFEPLGGASTAAEEEQQQQAGGAPDMAMDFGTVFAGAGLAADTGDDMDDGMGRMPLTMAMPMSLSAPDTGEEEEGPLDAADLESLLSQMDLDSDAMGLEQDANAMPQSFGTGPAAA